MLRVETTSRKAPCIEVELIRRPFEGGKGLAHHVPNTWYPDITPYTSYLTFRVQAPDRLQACANLSPQYLAQWGSRIAVAVQCAVKWEWGPEITAGNSNENLPSRENDSVCVQRAPIGEL
jgi:hypothetical protein